MIKYYFFLLRTDFWNCVSIINVSGTTLNLLKFPIVRPVGIHLYQRVKRLEAQRREVAEEEQLRKKQAKETGRLSHAALVGMLSNLSQQKQK